MAKQFISNEELKDFTNSEDLQTIVQNNYYRYQAKWLAWANGKPIKSIKASWNWSAFFFLPFWMIYRKMYLYGILVMIIPTILSLVLASGAANAVTTGIYIAMTIFANFFYLLHCKELVNKANQLFPDSYQGQTANPEQIQRRKEYLLQKGGTSTTATIIVIGIFCVVVFALSFIIIVAEMPEFPTNF